MVPTGVSSVTRELIRGVSRATMPIGPGVGPGVGPGAGPGPGTGPGTPRRLFRLETCFSSVLTRVESSATVPTKLWSCCFSFNMLAVSRRLISWILFSSGAGFFLWGCRFFCNVRECRNPFRVFSSVQAALNLPPL